MYVIAKLQWHTVQTKPSTPVPSTPGTSRHNASIPFLAADLDHITCVSLSESKQHTVNQYPHTSSNVALSTTMPAIHASG